MRRADALGAEWNALYQKRLESEAKRQAIADRRASQAAGMEEAEERTSDAQAALEECRSILAATLKVDDRINFDEFRRTDEFEPEPSPPGYYKLPPAPVREDALYQPVLGLFDRMIPTLRRKKEAACQRQFDEDVSKHGAEIARLQEENQKLYQRALAKHAAWSTEKEAFDRAKAAHNAGIDAKEAAYLRGDPHAVLEHFDLVLTRSKYPDFFPKEFTLDYREEAKTVIVDYTLPDFPSIPRLPSKRARQANYEMVLTLINDCLQGSVGHLGFVLAGTDECVEDSRRGLFSYEALRTRLQSHSFAQDGLVDFSGPVIRLSNLTAEELYVLLTNIRHVHASGDPAKHLVPDEALLAVLRQANDVLGAEYFKTPRDVIRSFVGLLNVIEQNPGTRWQDLVRSGNFICKVEKPTSVEEEVASGGVAAEDTDELATLKL